jgi:hypothetical protein
MVTGKQRKWKYGKRKREKQISAAFIRKEGRQSRVLSG